MDHAQRQTGPASPRQIAYVRDLAARYALFGLETSPQDTIAEVEQRIAAGLTGQGASELITAAGQADTHPRDKVPAREHTLSMLRYMARERAVFGVVIPREETIARMDALIEGGLTQEAADVLHRQAHRSGPYPTEKSPLPLDQVEGIDGLSVSEGHYAVLIEGVLRFYRVYTAPSGPYRGQVVMRRFASSNLLALYPGEAKTALALINADERAASYRFADEFRLCFVCARQLTDAVSRLMSVGPTCRGFHEHSGLRQAATEVDNDPTRRHVYRALRTWAVAQGFTDPRSKEQRKEMAGQMTASRLASAWSGLPGLLNLGTPEEVVGLVVAALDGNMAASVHDALLAAPADTLMILLDSGIMTQATMKALTRHPDAKVRTAAAEFFMSLLQPH
jgi:hypothetical protein